MHSVDCEFEADVLAAAIQSRWPDRTDPELRAHAAGCPVCSEVAAVAAAIDNAREESRGVAAVPDSGRVWWMARLRARREAAKAAARPITAAELVAGACAVGLLGACFGATSQWFQAELTWLRSYFPGTDISAALAAHWGLAAAAAGVLFLAPTAAWLAIRRD